ncbi:MAG: peptide chain release factor-like protein [Desulfobacterales bacterium]|nr:peptide chain release factor-like protein [Desulfobacterales bacterium]
MGPDAKKIKALEKKMEALSIHRGDLEEKFVKSSGRGGQKVNKTSSAVFIRHRPTGLSVKVGKHRSQNLNRFLALRQLVDNIEALKSGGSSKKDRERERIRKQKARRKRKSRAKKRVDVDGETSPRTPPIDTA